jgi:hypothetical protein
LSAKDMVSQTRNVSGFDQISLHAQRHNELIIKQGEQESLTIEAPRDILKRIETRVSQGRLTISLKGSLQDKLRDTIGTSITKPTIRYRVTVKTLTRLEVASSGRFGIGRMETERLAIVFKGAGEVLIGALKAKWLEVDFPGAGRIEVAGQVSEQTITLSGAGEYDAPRLSSQKAKVTINGVGKAAVWAEEALDVTIRGAGRVSYYGSPRISQSITAVGKLISLGEHP